ncbi:MAG TPA: hypothetical protein VFE19_14395 [Jatrophihabitantaceae bacterium]|jgi:hypothetical protein|nr:hypothetical protein [Jatrophihabitantaceae bacterium]
MSWTETHRYYGALRAIEAELDRRGDGIIVWHRDYADIFGSPDKLRLALRTRWATMVDAQIEVPFDAAGRPSPALCEVAAAHRGLLLALMRNVSPSQPAPRSDATLAGVA